MITTTRRVLGAAAVLTAVVAAAPLQAQQQAPRPERPNAERMHQRTNARLTPEQMIERRVDHLTAVLSLTPDQATRVQAILERESQQAHALFEKAGFGPGQGRMMGQRGQRADSARPRQAPTDEQRAEWRAQMDERRTQMQQLRDRTSSEIAQVLNAEQRQKFATLREQMQQRDGGPGMRGDRPARRGPGRMRGGDGA